MSVDEIGEHMDSKLSRRKFLYGAGGVSLGALLGLYGCSSNNKESSANNVSNESATKVESAPSSGVQNNSHTTNDPSKAVWPTTEEFDCKGAGDGKVAFISEKIDSSEIKKSYDVDVVVCGLGHAGHAAALSCAENGLKTVVVEKKANGNYNSPTIGGFNSKIHQHWGVSFDTDAWLSDAMNACSYQGDMSRYKHYITHADEAVDWYISHFENQNLDDYKLTFASGDFPDFRDQYDKTSLSRSWNTSINLPDAPPKLLW